MRTRCPFCGHFFLSSPDHRGMQTPVDCPWCKRTFHLDGEPLSPQEMWHLTMETVRDYFAKRRVAAHGAARSTGGTDNG